MAKLKQGVSAVRIVLSRDVALVALNQHQKTMTRALSLRRKSLIRMKTLSWRKNLGGKYSTKNVTWVSVQMKRLIHPLQTRRNKMGDPISLGFAIWTMVKGIEWMTEEGKPEKKPVKKVPPQEPARINLPAGSELIVHKRKHVRAGDKDFIQDHIEALTPENGLLEYDISNLPHDHTGRVIKSPDDVVHVSCECDAWMHKDSTRQCSCCGNIYCLEHIVHITRHIWVCEGCRDTYTTEEVVKKIRENEGAHPKQIGYDDKSVSE
jgi:hypothetical protein